MMQCAKLWLGWGLRRRSKTWSAAVLRKEHELGRAQPNPYEAEQTGQWDHSATRTALVSTDCRMVHIRDDPRRIPDPALSMERPIGSSACAGSRRGDLLRLA